MKREIDVLSISLSAHVLRTRMGGRRERRGEGRTKKSLRRLLVLRMR
tara:strand:- start:161 stop:301 length:141 start_codon:yes stop_codon:yes gene_type:complete